MSDQLTSILLSSALAFAIAFVVALVVPAVAKRITQKRPAAYAAVTSAKIPFRILLLVAAINVVYAAHRPRGDVSVWWDYSAHGLRIAAIINAAWLIGVVVIFFVDAATRRANRRLADRDARRMRTQVQVLRRIIIALVVVFAVAAVLLTFDGVRAVGASLIASAGLASVVAALAAQSTLGNLFAGLQLAFSDAVRLDDVVVVEGEYGTVEEITLSYVVVRVWDDRRLILPCTYFTTNPIENWTRRNSEMMGTVEFDVDWRVNIKAMRARFEQVLADTDLYNGRSHSLVLTDSTGGTVRVRAGVTAVDPDALWFLQCHVREELVQWLQEENPEGLPQTRIQVDTRSGAPTAQ